MKNILYILFCFFCLCGSALSLTAQKVKAVYDSKAQKLTITNNHENLLKIEISEDTPLCFNSSFQCDEDKEIGPNDSVSWQMDSSCINEIDSIDVKLFLGGDPGRPERWGAQRVAIIKLPDESHNTGSASNCDANSSPQSSESHMFIYLIVGAVLLLLVLLLLFKRKRRPQVDRPVMKGKPVMQVIEEEQNDYKNGLQYVREDISNYYVLNMEDFFRDTAVKQVLFSREAIRKLNSYFKEFLERPERTNETGCYLIGGWENFDGRIGQYNISIEEMVMPGDDAVYDEFSLNFGLKIGIKLGSEIQNLCEKTGRDYVHTAWMHSHPGLGLFLSSHDLVVQKQLAYEDAPKRMIAIVIDTNTPDWQMAIFSSKNNGVMNNKEDLLTTISFDILNDWSRQKPTSVHSPLSFDEAYVVKSDDEKEQFAFSAKFINFLDDIDCALCSDAIFYCYGEKAQVDGQRIWTVIEGGKEKSDSAVGCLMMADDSDSSRVKLLRYSLLGGCGFCVAFHPNGDMELLYQDDNNTNHAIHLSLKAMKEWTRRKRI